MTTSFMSHLGVLLIAVVPIHETQGATDPCRDQAKDVASVAQQYRAAAREISSSCTQSTGDCAGAELAATALLDQLTIVHELMLSECGSTNPPPPAAVPPEAPGDLVITEFMANPWYSIEWFEIYNPTSTDFALKGLTISDDGTDVYQIQCDLVIPVGGYIVLGENADQTTNGHVPVGCAYGTAFILGNDADEIQILNGTTVIDRVAYARGPFPIDIGHSASLDPDFASNYLLNDEGQNWCFSMATTGYDYGTPGSANEQCP